MIPIEEIEDYDKFHEQLKSFFKAVPFGRFILDHTLDTSMSIALELDNFKSYLKTGKSWVALKDDKIIGLLACRASEWDSNHFGYKVGKLNYFLISDMEPNKETVAQGLMKVYNEWIAHNAIKLIIAKIDTYHYFPTLALQRDDFIFYECLTYRALLDLDIPGEIDYRYARKEDRENLIAAFNNSTFKKSHFYLDEKFDPKKIDEMYDKWIANAFESSSEIIIIEEGTDIAGVCMVSINEHKNYFNKTIATWEFAAIAEAHRGKGLGNKLYLSTIKDCHKKGAELLDATVIAKNILSQRILNKYKFNLMNSEFTFHKWY